MKIDRTMKILLAVIALGLFLNVAAELLRPEPVSAQFGTTIEDRLRNIENYLEGISRGTCLNREIC